VLANDPDADRLAAAVPDGRGGFRQLTGNELGALLGEYVLQHGEGARRLVVTTIVSSPMLRQIAAQLGVQYGEVLTGFKWITNLAMEREAAGSSSFAFGYELRPARAGAARRTLPRGPGPRRGPPRLADRRLPRPGLRVHFVGSRGPCKGLAHGAGGASLTGLR
jgi:hypothetical protein